MLPEKYKYICHHTVPVEKLMFDGFQMHQGVVILNKSKQLYLAFVMRMIDNKQVYCIIWWEQWKHCKKKKQDKPSEIISGDHIRYVHIQAHSPKTKYPSSVIMQNQLLTENEVIFLLYILPIFVP